MKTFNLLAIVLLSTPVGADTFGNGANQFTMDFVNISVGNIADDTGYGAVGYDYRMGKYEVSRAMIDSYSALSGGPGITMQDMTSFGGNDANKPATGISWNEAARFVNWLNTSRGFSPAYKFITGGGNDNIALWTGADAGYDASNPFRNSNALYFLPSEDEWYRAAFYDPNAEVYWNYATGSDTEPAATNGGNVEGTAVYGQPNTVGPALTTNAGDWSPHGTMAQNGNAWEWCESGVTPPNNTAIQNRVLRGGYWFNEASALPSSVRIDSRPDFESWPLGLRIASGTVTNYFTIILSTTGGAIAGAGEYAPGTTAILNATPDPGYLFTGWSGDATGTVNPLSILMDSDKTIGATFDPDLADDDGDGLTNHEEGAVHGTNPNLSDTDGDDLTDGQEVNVTFTDPTDEDTDGDGFFDGFEVSSGFDPNTQTSAPDSLSSIHVAVEFRFSAATGETYRIEGSDDMQSWTIVEDEIVGNGSQISRFYSIEGQPFKVLRATKN